MQARPNGPSTIVTLMCHGKTCCPTVEKFSDGSIILHDTDDGRDQHIPLSPEQVDQLLHALGVVTM